MKKLSLSLVLLLGLTVVANAAERTLEQMKTAAGKVIKAPAGFITRGADGTTLEVLKKGEQLTVIGYKAGGFAVVANDDVFSPILGYSDTPFTGNPNPGLQWWINAMEQSLAANKKADRIVNYAEALTSEYKAQVDALVKTHWDQGAPYNDLCPEYKENNIKHRYPSGCVATAMAQIMKYYSYPTVGTDYYTYRFVPQGSTTAINLTANFDWTTYRWDTMLDEYTPGAYTAEQGDAVAELMFHCGVAVEMQYSPDGSGAFLYDAAAAMRKYFSYDTRHYYRDVFPTNAWMGMIYDELSNGRPILYSGVESSYGGHAFVLDGYNEEGLVHVNWGWSGKGDGFFTIAGLDGYTAQQTIVLIHCGDAPKLPTSSLFGLYGGNITLAKNALRVNLTLSGVLYNITSDPFVGEIAFVAENDATGEVTSVLSLMNVAATDPVLPGYGYNLSSTVQTSVSSLDDGTYHLYLATKSNKDTGWQMVRSNENVRSNYVMTKTGSSFTLTPGDNEWYPATGIENVVVDGNATDKVNVYNANGMLIHSAAAAGFNVNDVPGKGLLIIKQGNTTRKVVK